MRVLITGLSGFIGGHLWHTVPPDIQVWGTYFRHTLPDPERRIWRLDLTHSPIVNALITELKPHLIIHAAAYSRVSYCEEQPIAAYSLNTLTTAELARICGERGIRLIFLSSDMVFNGLKGNYSESDSPAPVNYYGWTKWAAETHVHQLQEKGLILRVNLTYGPPVQGGSSFSEEVIKTIRAGQPYYLFADQYRSPISVTNLAIAIWELAQSDVYGVVHLGGSESVDRYTFALQLAKQVGLDKRLLIKSSMHERPQGVQQPANNTFNLDYAQSLLKTRLWGIAEGLEQEYPKML